MSTPTQEFGTTYEYELVARHRPERLEEAVRLKLAAGWQLAGGMTFVESLAQGYIQTMFRINTNTQLLKS